MLNQAALEALYSATYVDNFLALLEDMENLRSHYLKENESQTMKKTVLHLQGKLILAQEIADEKLQIAQHILDIIDNRQRQLDLDCKNLDLEQEEKSDTCKDAISERSNKRPRRSKVENNHNHNDSSNDIPTTPLVEKSGLTRTVSNRGSAHKKNSKKKKRKSRTEREREDSPPEVSIDPNEPTYCLCEQD
ncbi:Inhibitor of growth protein 2, partial [Armadillidium vulgare]